MTSLAQHVPRIGLHAAPRAGRDLGVVRAGRQQVVALVTITVVACLVTGAILLFAAFAGIDTTGPVPHPVPLPAPTGTSFAGN